MRTLNNTVSFFEISTVAGGMNNLATFGDTHSHVTIFHQNLCGINNKKNELEIYITELPNELGFICISEHFLNKIMVSQFDLPNYNVSSSNTRLNKTRGGTLVLTHKKKQVEDLDICKRLYKTDSFEVCGVRDVETNSYIICCYRTPVDKNFDDFLNGLEQLLQYFFNKICFICGDFNIDLTKHDNKSSSFTSLLKCYNFRYLFDSITFLRNNSKSCIDNILTNTCDRNISSTDIDHNRLADGHAALFCTAYLEKVTSTQYASFKYIERRLYNEKNNNAFRQKLLEHDWNLGTNTFLRKIKELHSSTFKKSKVKINIKRTSRSKWLTKGIRISSKMKRFLNCINKAKCDKSLLKYREQYFRTYKKVIRNAKKKEVTNQINKAANSSKEIWKIVNKTRKKIDHNFENDNIILKHNNKIICNPKDIANIFAQKFDNSKGINTGNPELAKKHLIENTERVDKSMAFNPVMPIEIYKMVKGMDSKKSFGHDDIPLSVIKDNIDLLAHPISEIINNCINEGVFPDQFKLARVLPLLKKGAKTDPDNYRPISLLPVLSKLFEKVIKSRLVRHLTSLKIINHNQFGYQKSKGTLDAIDSLLNSVVNKLNNKLKVAGLFLDLSSAFDTVEHCILMDKLEHYGVRGNVLKILRSYLTNRKQYVEIKSLHEGVEEIHKSKLFTVTRGVPQGSVLGPIFFIIFLNDLTKYIKNILPDADLIIFADDTSAVIADDNIETLKCKLNVLIAACESWFSMNNLKLNVSKTKCMIFRSTVRNKVLVDVESLGRKIDIVESLKFLGVRIDCLLNWKPELDSVTNTISSACYAIRSLRDVLSIAQLRTVYFALVESKLRYSIKFWGNSYEYNIKAAFTIQKRALRTMLRLKQTVSCKEYFIKLGILTLPSLYILVLLTHLIKNLNEFETDDERKNRVDTRRKDLPSIIQAKLNVVKHSSRVQSVNLFNKLPAELKNIQNVNMFKNKLRAMLLNKAYYSIDEYCNDRRP